MFSLRIYTALKQCDRVRQILHSLFSLRIYTALKLMALAADSSTVCFPYEFTLLSNTGETGEYGGWVCFPYEFTLLSN